MALHPLPVGSRVSSWGEGPLWWQDRLYSVDIESHSVVRFDPVSGQETVWNTGERVGCVVPRSGGGLVIAGDNGFSFLDPVSGTKSPIADPEPDKKPDNRFNDGKCDPAGRFWAGTISTVKKTGDARLYRLDPDLRVSEVYGPVTNSNGICWNAAADVMYYIDTPTRKVLAFDYHLETGAISDPRTVIDTAALGIEGSPDGMTIDWLGNLWIAICHGGCVLCFDPSTGKPLERIEYPCIETTAPAFGGPDLRTLYVTTGIKKGLEEPLAGRLFAVELPVRGLPTHPFAG
jgi:sugar lactone lactonase YvrE